MSKLNIGDRWQLKNDPTKIATIVSFNVVSMKDLHGYVYLTMPWTVSGESGKSLDTFLKQYRKI